MPVLLSEPKYKKVKCEECSSTIGYLPEDIQEYHGRDYGGGPDGYKRVKCPRQHCKGYGYIERW